MYGGVGCWLRDTRILGELKSNKLIVEQGRSRLLSRFLPQLGPQESVHPYSQRQSLAMQCRSGLSQRHTKRAEALNAIIAKLLSGIALLLSKVIPMHNTESLCSMPQVMESHKIWLRLLNGYESQPSKATLKPSLN
jgi:hypothetical protein